MEFINKDFILKSSTAQRLYHQYAEKLPIIDYHCHLNPQEIAENKPFATITDLWLAGDHYKWRAMRANGIPEEQITGAAAAEVKFKAWAESIEACVGNPLYHWTALELKKYFQIHEVLTVDNWEKIYQHCNGLLTQAAYTPRGLIAQSNVEVICTTDSMVDSLEYHEKIAGIADFKTKVLPTLRPDEALNFSGDAFLQFIKKLEQCTGIVIQNYDDFLRAAQQRIEFFHARGCRLSDHGLMGLYYVPVRPVEQMELFVKKLHGAALSAAETRQYQSGLLVDLARLYAEKNWTMQIHFGAIRNNNQKAYRELGVDQGFDSIYDQAAVAIHLNALLNAMEEADALPRLIVYNLDPSLNDVVASSLANFQQNSKVKGKLQFGAGWWFNDTKRGMLRQMEALADQGLLMHFVGMLTDSRSFISYTRHEYFRRIFCDFIGTWVKNGEIPQDEKLLQRLVENVCYKNAKGYFGF